MSKKEMRKEMVRFYNIKARFTSFLLDMSANNLEDANFWNKIVVPEMEKLLKLNEKLKKLGLEKKDWFEHPVLAESIIKNADRYYFLGQIFFSIDQPVLAIKCFKRSMALYSLSVFPQDALLVKDTIEDSLNYFLSNKNLSQEQVEWAKSQIKDSINYWYCNAYVRFLDLYTEKLGFYDSFLSPNRIYKVSLEAKNYSKRFRS
jgi:hypothetical protein